MKILLISPSRKESLYTSHPLGLCYIAGMIKKEHEVEILDCPALKYKLEDAGKYIKSYKPDLVGISVTTPDLVQATKLSELIKSHSKAVVVAGGPHPSLLPGDVISLPSVDIVVRGEGEFIFKNLVSAIEQSKDLKIVDGICFKKNGKVICTSLPKPIEDLDSLPFPARELLPIDKYKQLIGFPDSFITLITSRGCPFSCIYCSKGVFGNRTRFRTPENILKEIKENVEKYNIKELIFYDDTFTLNKERVMKICDLLIENKINIPWKCETRVDTVDYELLKKMKEAGCFIISYGVESGNEKILKTIQKVVNKDRIRKTFRLTKKVGIQTLGYFMIGIPGETKETIKDTLDFAIELDPDYAQFSIATPYPGTQLYKMVLEKNLLIEKDWTKYSYVGDNSLPVIRTEELSQEDLLVELKNIMHKFYFRPKYIFKQFLKCRDPQILKRNICALKTLLSWNKKKL
ncbi:MAG: radical SAM protein [Candidatus Aenigmarchaeota archaeon]|nr:radical SAM protein [Candidatus Aenigmarchaeota archaeon]